ncbi:hypothetical protein V495_03663 [Pseudogymnoascus sp. VKM F-4514 (FW-929)]|nr:hypothetical protein V495_03663 [Pseudogymnoascus sp. VKM F-4514 (FW-929)]
MVYSLEALRHLSSKAYEIEARFRGLVGHEVLAFNVRQSPNDEEVTRVIFSLSINSVSVDRSKSSLIHGRLTPDSGPFKLQDGEDLHVRVFVDNSIVEVYANGRFALASRVYPSRPDALGASCSFEGVDAENVGVWMQAWEGLVGAWPERGREVVGLDGRMGEMEIEDEYEDYESEDADAEFEVYGAFERVQELGGVGVGVEARAVVA